MNTYDKMSQSIADMTCILQSLTSELREKLDSDPDVLRIVTVNHKVNRAIADMSAARMCLIGDPEFPEGGG